MSTRCSIAFAGPLHIYAEANDGWNICISDVHGYKSSYNGNVTMTHQELRDLYGELKLYFEERKAPYERYAAGSE